ncbi:response regulator transcription factor, partial [Saccharopolyspora sp. 6V]|uniref:response regulator transcription factor n=1 Tax=Saccharopolyspora sp. 6V TaxID=2877239 RepID=UPI0035A892E0|nr:hypothetical protein [Saccharopolyspora sp. 6V]
MGDGSTRVLLGDDHAIFVDALVSALSARGFPVVGTAGSIAATVAAVRRLAPDICLLDRFFGDGDGVAGGAGGGGGFSRSWLPYLSGGVRRRGRGGWVLGGRPPR